MLRQLLFTALVGCCSLSYGQQTDYTLKVNPEPILLQENAQKAYPKSDDNALGERKYRLIQFYKTPSQGEKEQMQAIGIRFFDYIPPFAYQISAPKTFDYASLRSYGVRAVSDVPVTIKLSQQISNGIATKYVKGNGLVHFMVMFQNDVSEEIAKYIFSQNNVDFTSFNKTTNYLTGYFTEAEIDYFIAYQEVKFIDIVPIPKKEDNHSRSLHRSLTINPYDPLSDKYDGTGVSVAVNDDGFVGPHIDFTGRTEQSTVASDLAGDHGDMVAGILGGAGNLNPINEGMAKGAFLHVRQYNSTLPNTVTLHQNDSVMIFSSSYGDGCNAGYTGLSQQVDQEIRQNESLIQVFSCGNSGNSNCSYGAGSGWGNITGGHKQGKNVIATANLDRDETLRASSSRGPASDGRIKPDIAANGHNQISTDPNNTYSAGSGTSAAAPGISGVLAQLYQAYRSFNGVNPESSLIKASMLNSAEDFGNVGPDFQFGWGRVHARRALDILENNQYQSGTISQGQNQNMTVNVPAGVKEVRFMVYWRDYEGSTSAALALVNDIDMTVTEGSNTYLPWILDPTPNATNLALPATNGADHLNNMEQVAIVNPSAGVHTINISGFNIPQGPQGYWMVYTYIYDDINVVYPNGGEGLVPGETKRVYWDAYDNTGNFDLAYSTDAGSNWNTITSVTGSDRSYEWTIPTGATGQAMFRISRGGVQDVSDTTFSIIEDPQNLDIIQVCSTYLKLSWDPVPNAHSYEVYILGNKYMDSVGVTTNTSFDIMTNVFTEQWVSVAAITPDDTTMLGRRAIAIYYDGSGILNCSAPNDLSVSTLISPNGSSTCDAGSLPVSAEVVNSGQNTLTNFQVKYQVTGQAIQTETFPGSLNSAQTTVINFTTPVTLTSPGLYPIKVWVEHPLDSDPFNDTLFSTIDFASTSITTYPYTQDFEGFGNCGTATDCADEICVLGNGWANLENLVEDGIDWRVDLDGTPSTGTGPDIDHTTNSATGQYIYLEASGGCEGEEAILESPCIDLTNALSADLSFWYHMEGINMGDLHVDAYDGTNWVADILPSISGDQGASWLNGVANLNAYVGSYIKLRFRGITGSGWESDIALDDINLNIVEDTSSNIGINEQADLYQMLLYPNPSQGAVAINYHLNGAQGRYLTIHNMVGKEVRRVLVNGQTEGNIQLDLTDLANGVYNMRLATDDGEIVKRLVVRK